MHNTKELVSLPAASNVQNRAECLWNRQGRRLPRLHMTSRLRHKGETHSVLEHKGTAGEITGSILTLYYTQC